MFEKIIKRNQEIAPFERSKIEAAVFKALVVVDNNRTRSTLKNLSVSITDRVIHDLHKTIENLMPTVEEIQDAVEIALMVMGEHETAKAYIKYRYKHLERRETKKSAMDILSLFDDYIGQNDWMVKENSNTGYSLQGLNNHIIGKATKHFWLNQVYSETIKEAHESGDMHIHDLGLLSTYCCGWRLEDILIKGFGGVAGKVESLPPKHFEAVLMQLVNFIFTLQGEAAGAQAISNFDTLLAPFVRNDNLNYEQVKQMMQTFIFNMNIATRVGFQTPFFNITFDKEVPITHMDLPVIIGGHYQYDLTYGDFQKEMDLINRAFCEVMLAGDAKGRIFAFPIPTYNITKDWNWDDDVCTKIMEMTGKYGIPYFGNFVNSILKPEDVRSMCCNLRLDNKTLLRRGGGLFGAHPKTGSIGVVTINMPRLGYLSHGMDDLLTRLERVMEIAKNALESKRRILEENMTKGLYPYSKYYLEDIYALHQEYWYNHFSTIGPNGMHECIVNFTHGTEGIATPVGKEIAEEILDFMNEVLLRFQNETGHLFNLEASPAEASSYRFAQLDLESFPDIRTSGESAPYYTNSTALPANYTDDLFDALEHQESLQLKYSGGTVFHGFVPERINDIELIKKTLHKIMHHSKIPYFTLTPTFSICPTHQYLSGEIRQCPYCHSETEVWSRVVGYHRPVKEWHAGKQEEFYDRKVFDLL